MSSPTLFITIQYTGLNLIKKFKSNTAFQWIYSAVCFKVNSLGPEKSLLFIQGSL